MRILIAGILGAIAMFAWTAVAHMATPLGMTGFSRISDEAPVLAAMSGAMGAQGGLYIFPWVDPNDPKMMEKVAELEKVNPHGMILYHGAGQNMETDMGPLLTAEFIKQLVQTLIAAWIASMIAAGFATRWLTVIGIGISASIATNVSYWNWYGFPMDYTLAQIVIEIVGAIVAGAAIAWWLGRGTAKTA
jgi:hypothetical protein